MLCCYIVFGNFMVIFQEWGLWVIYFDQQWEGIQGQLLQCLDNIIRFCYKKKNSYCYCYCIVCILCVIYDIIFYIYFEKLFSLRFLRSKFKDGIN